VAQSLRRIVWTPEKDARLGTASDVALGREWGYDRKTVGLRRRLLKIRHCRAPRKLHTVICEACKKPFQIHGRSDRLRRTHPPPQRSGLRLSACHRQLLSDLALNRQPMTLAATWKKPSGMSFIR
jgi:hypothetical protein